MTPASLGWKTCPPPGSVTIPLLLALPPLEPDASSPEVGPPVPSSGSADVLFPQAMNAGTPAAMTTTQLAQTMRMESSRSDRALEWDASQRVPDSECWCHHC